MQIPTPSTCTSDLIRVGVHADWMPQPVVLCQLAALLEGSPTQPAPSRIARENTINRPAVFGRQCGLRFRSPSY
jgi:hypothetical protein